MTERRIVTVHQWYGNERTSDDYEAILCDDGTLIPLNDEEESEYAKT